MKWLIDYLLFLAWERGSGPSQGEGIGKAGVEQSWTKRLVALGLVHPHQMGLRIRRRLRATGTFVGYFFCFVFFVDYSVVLSLNRSILFNEEEISWFAFCRIARARRVRSALPPVPANAPTATSAPTTAPMRSPSTTSPPRRGSLLGSFGIVNLFPPR